MGSMFVPNFMKIERSEDCFLLIRHVMTHTVYFIEGTGSYLDGLILQLLIVYTIIQLKE